MLALTHPANTVPLTLVALDYRRGHRNRWEATGPHHTAGNVQSTAHPGCPPPGSSPPWGGGAVGAGARKERDGPQARGAPCRAVHVSSKLVTAQCGLKQAPAWAGGGGRAGIDPGSRMWAVDASSSSDPGPFSKGPQVLTPAGQLTGRQELAEQPGHLSQLPRARGQARSPSARTFFLLP